MCGKVSEFSTIDSIHIHNNMHGGNNTSTRPVSKPGQPNPVKTAQTLLAAKKKDTSNKESRAKRTHSEVSNDANTCHDLSGLINFQKDLDEIKISLREGLGSCSAGSLGIATTSLSSKVTFRSRLTKLIKS
jgi:hypothetical protein